MEAAIEYANEKIDLKISKIQSKIDQLNEKLNEPEDTIIRLTCEVEEFDELYNDMDDGWALEEYDKTEDKSYIKDFMTLFKLISEHGGTLHGYDGEYTKVGSKPLYGGAIYKGKFTNKDFNDPEVWTVDYFKDNWIVCQEFEVYECVPAEVGYGLSLNLKFFVDLPKNKCASFTERCESELKHIPTPWIE